MNNGIYPTKATKGIKIVKPYTDDLPSSFKVNSNDIKNQDKGIYKLRARNESIREELNEWAAEAKTKLSTIKSGDRIFYIMPELGITVNLINA